MNVEELQDYLDLRTFDMAPRNSAVFLQGFLDCVDLVRRGELVLKKRVLTGAEKIQQSERISRRRNDRVQKKKMP